jgi:hypothetical protein
MSDGSTPIIVFRNGSATGSEILWAASSTITAPDVCYDFTPTNNDTIPSHYTNTGSSYSYSYTPSTPPVLPNPAGFISALVSDTTIQPLFYLLAPYHSVILSYGVNASAVQLLWSQLCTQYSAQLTSSIQATIEGYATANNMPLT